MKMSEVRKLLTETDGQIFSVKFRKRTPPHEVRQMVCRTGVKKGLVENPSKPPVDARANQLVVVWDMQAGGYRSIPLEGVFEIKIDGIWISVKSGFHVGDIVTYVGDDYKITKDKGNDVFDLEGENIFANDVKAQQLELKVTNAETQA